MQGRQLERAKDAAWDGNIPRLEAIRDFATSYEVREYAQRKLHDDPSFQNEGLYSLNREALTKSKKKEIKALERDVTMEAIPNSDLKLLGKILDNLYRYSPQLLEKEMSYFLWHAIKIDNWEVIRFLLEESRTGKRGLIPEEFFNAVVRGAISDGNVFILKKILAYADEEELPYLLRSEYLVKNTIKRGNKKIAELIFGSDRFRLNYKEWRHFEYDLRLAMNTVDGTLWHFVQALKRLVPDVYQYAINEIGTDV